MVGSIYSSSIAKVGSICCRFFDIDAFTTALAALLKVSAILGTITHYFFRNDLISAILSQSLTFFLAEQYIEGCIDVALLSNKIKRIGLVGELGAGDGKRPRTSVRLTARAHPVQTIGEQMISQIGLGVV